MKASIKVETDELITSVQQQNSKLMKSLEVIGDSGAKKMMEYAQHNAPWTDRTGNARQKLMGSSFWEDSKNLVVAVYHQVDYGIYLELAHERKYAILEKTVKEMSGELIKAFKKLVS